MYPHYLETGIILRNRYEIIARLGEGSFGETYKAEDIDKLRKEVVVKRLKINHFSETNLETATRLFEREAQTLKNLDHPMIPQLEAYFTEEDKNRYLVMEYIKGNTLDEQELQENHQLQQQEVIELLKNILEVLRIVHKNGFIHRDVKPNNLIRRAKDRKITLIDFGSVTRQISLEPQPDAKLTAIGNQGYAPPEQQWNKQAFPSTDIYPVGIIAIQALTGRSPGRFIKDPDNQNIIWNEVPASENFKKVIQKMTDKKHSERYQSVDEVLQALNLIEKPESIPPAQLDQSKPEKVLNALDVMEEPGSISPPPENNPSNLGDIKNSSTELPQKNTKPDTNILLNLIGKIPKVSPRIVGSFLSLVALLSIAVVVLVWLNRISTTSNVVNPNLFPMPDRPVVSGAKIKIGGSITMVRLNKAFKEGFEKKFPSTIIDLAAYQDTTNLGSNYGIKLLCDGKVDIAAISRSLHKDEKCPDGKKLFAVRVGTDSLSVIVHRDNPVNNLSKSQVKEIFQCQIPQWTDIDPTWPGKNIEVLNRQIEVLNRPPQSGTYNYFQESFLGNEDFCPPGSPNYINLKQLADDKTTPTIKNFTINQIVYAGYGVTDDSRIKRLSIDNVKPEDASYPYQRPLYYVYKADSAENASLPVKQFLGFVLNFYQSTK